MNLLFSCIGKRGYIADYFRPHLSPVDKIIGTSNLLATPGFRSCDEAVLMPDIVAENYVKSVEKLCRDKCIHGLLSFFDLDVMTLASHLPRIRATGTIPILPTKEQSECAFDKLNTYSFLTEKGIGTAKTFGDLESALAALRTGELQYPVYVKPRYGFGSRNTFSAPNQSALRAYMSLEENMIVQETLVGEAYNIEACNDLNGKPLAVIPWRKQLSRMGETEHAETCEFPELLELGVALCEQLGHVGPLDADVFVDNERIRVLELNLRFGGGYPVSQLAGADFPELIVQLIAGEKPQPRIGKYRRNVMMMKQLVPFGGPIETVQNDELHLADDYRS